MEIEWPAELDALVAAPEHHKLLMENEYVRVLDTLIPPGETTKLHTHQYPATLYIKSWSSFIRRDEMGNVVMDSNSPYFTIEPGRAVWSGPITLHTLENTGDQNLHVICVEVK